MYQRAFCLYSLCILYIFTFYIASKPFVSLGYVNPDFNGKSINLT